MVSTYTSNKTGAIATLLAGALVVVLVFILWILIPLYLKRIKPAFIAGIVLMLIALTMLSPAFMPLTEEHSFFGISGDGPSFGIFTSMNLYGVSFGIFDLVGLAFIYFSYKSSKEIRSHSQREPTS